MERDRRADAERTFRVRHHECDGYGHLNNTGYLRYLEELELTAGAAGGAAGRLWDAARITYVQPVGFGDEVTVAARSVGTGPVPQVREYRFRRAGDGEEVATARVQWRRDGVPSRPPEAVLPGAARPFVQRRVVEWRDVDASSRLSPATLAEWAEDCGLALLAAFGWPLQRCTDAEFAMVLRSHDIAYGDLPSLGDELTVTTWASDATRISAVRHYLFTAGAAVVARFASRYVWVDAATMRPIRIPADFLADFAENFAAPPR